MIPYGRQSIDAADIDAVVQVLQSDFLTQGPAIPAFEAELSRRCGSPHAIATSSATAALHLACIALGVGPGDLVWTSPITFVASANCARYCGADVDFVDIDPRTYNLSPVALEEKLRHAARVGRLPKVVIPVHLAGQSCDMASIRKLTDAYGVRVIEDASHAVGATYRDQPVGSCLYSDITVFSFHPVKIVTSGEGGMAVTGDPTLARRMELLRSHGITRDPSEMHEESPGSWYYEQLALGFHYRLTDIQAALGLSQLARLESFVAKRQELAARYDAAFEGVPLQTPFQSADTRSSWHLYVVRVGAAKHRGLFEALRARGIGVNLHYIPVYLQPYYRQLGFERGLCPEAESYYAQAISLPLYPDLTTDSQDEIVAAVASELAA